MKALHRVFGYLAKFPSGKIIIDTSKPPIREEMMITKGQNWIEFYPDAMEELPPKMPSPKGTSTTITCFVDSDHARDQVTRRSVTGILLLLDNTPLVWVCKRQRTVETSTYGAELVAAKMAVDLIIKMRYKLCMLGVVLEETLVLLGDNMSVILNTTIPSSSLK